MWLCDFFQNHTKILLYPVVLFYRTRGTILSYNLTHIHNGVSRKNKVQKAGDELICIIIFSTDSIQIDSLEDKALYHEFMIILKKKWRRIKK